MAIYAANNLFKAINKYAPSGGAKLGGVIANSITQGYAKEIVDDFTSRTGTTVAGYVERSIVVQQSELYGKTVIEANPTSKQADIYRNLAKHIAENEDLVVPNPLSSTELRDWARDWGDKIYNLKADAAGTVAAQA